jgi:small subunit ribosomal protein S17
MSDENVTTTDTPEETTASAETVTETPAEEAPANAAEETAVAENQPLAVEGEEPLAAMETAFIEEAAAVPSAAVADAEVETIDVAAEGADETVASAAPAKPTYDPTRGRRKVRQGRVVSTKMQKTVVVLVETRVRHPLYGKFMRRSTKFKAHDETEICGEGDTVEIMETRPLSKTKNWRVVRILEKAK